MNANFFCFSLTQPSIRDKDGNTALHLTCINGYQDMVIQVISLLNPFIDDELKQYKRLELRLLELNGHERVKKFINITNHNW